MGCLSDAAALTGRIEQDTYGVFHLSNRESNGGGLADLSVVFGTGGDVPVAGRWYNPTCPSADGMGGGAAPCVQVTPTPTPSPTPTVTPIPTVIPSRCTVRVTASGGLKFRESPTYNSPLLAIIPKETALTAVYKLETPDIWYQVTYNNQKAWIGAQVGGIQNVDNVNCALPAPYPSSWIALAQIEQSELLRNNVCDVDGYLRTEDPALVMARVAYAEAATYYQPVEGGEFTGGVVYEDAFRIAWIIRMNALMGLPNYRLISRAGVSVSIADTVLAQGIYDPITRLRQELNFNGCQPLNITDPLLDNVRRMVYPENSAGKAELYQLYRIYQTIRISIMNAPWVAMYQDIQRQDQFKGVDINATCPSGADGLSRPGTGFTWASDQPYPPVSVYAYLDPKPLQARKTCYQDTHHLDDLFLAALLSPQADLPQVPAGFAANAFPLPPNKSGGYCVKILVNPDSPSDIYPLAQLTGKSGLPWPAGQCP